MESHACCAVHDLHSHSHCDFENHFHVHQGCSCRFLFTHDHGDIKLCVSIRCSSQSWKLQQSIGYHTTQVSHLMCFCFQFSCECFDYFHICRCIFNSVCDVRLHLTDIEKCPDMLEVTLEKQGSGHFQFPCFDFFYLNRLPHYSVL